MIARRHLLLASGVLWVPLDVLPQPRAKGYRVGLLDQDPQKGKSRYWDVILAELAQRGYVDGRNLSFVARAGGKDVQDLERAAVDLAAQRVDLIFAVGGAGAQAAKKATQTIPIFAWGSGDPVRAGLVASLARPGGNITGTAVFQPQLGVKRKQLIADALGKPERLAILSVWTPDSEVPTTVPGHRMQFHHVRLKSVDELEEAFAGMARQQVDGLVVDDSPLISRSMERIAALAARHRLPAIAGSRQFAEAGLLMSYGVDDVDLARKSAATIDSILKGAKPGDLPFARAMKFEFVINLRTAKALGLTIPQALLMRADDMIS